MSRHPTRRFVAQRLGETRLMASSLLLCLVWGACSTPSSDGEAVRPADTDLPIPPDSGQDEDVRPTDTDLPIPPHPSQDPAWVEYYQPTPESLNAHPIPAWYMDARFGIFVHWGPYSVPAYADPELPVPLTYAEWYWFFQLVLPDGPVFNHHEDAWGTDVVYDDFIDLWRAEAFDADELAALVEASGARYAVLVTKHHDGVALFNTATTRRDTVDLGPKRDLVREYVEAMRSRGIRAGLYYSLLEWFHPAYDGDGGVFHIGPLDLAKPALVNPYTGEPVPYRGYEPEITDFVGEHLLPQLDELSRQYHPDILWLDGHWEDVGSGAFCAQGVASMWGSGRGWPGVRGSFGRARVGR